MGNKFLGLSYVLLGIPYLGLIGVILVPIAWIADGVGKRRRLWVVCGFTGLIAIALFIAGVIQVLSVTYPVIVKYGTQLGNMPNLSENELLNLVNELKPYVMSGVATFAAAIISALVFYILMVVSLFQAGDVYFSNVIKIGATLFIALFMFVIGGAGFVIASAVYGNSESLRSSAEYVGLGAMIMNLLASLTSGLGFLLSRPSEGV